MTSLSQGVFKLYVMTSLLSDTDSLSSDASQEEKEAAITARNTLFRQLQQNRRQAEASLQVKHST